MQTKDPLLEINNLNIGFQSNDTIISAVKNINLTIYKDEILGIVGESGSGKSITALSLMRLLPTPPAIIEGQVFYHTKDGHVQDLLQLSYEDIRQYRGSHIGMVFQEPMTSLNPVFKIKTQMVETVLQHNPKMSKQDAIDRSVELLEQVGISDGRRRLEDYPHQYSGGMRQRVMIAMALLNNPSLLIADEPTTALDVTIQAQILDLMIALKEKRKNSAIMLITHDMAVIAETCHRVVVMYGGCIQEIAPVETLFKNPLHPYTVGLLNSIPNFNKIHQEYLSVIPGMVPSLTDMPQGCAFSTRCEHECNQKNTQLCMHTVPELIEVEEQHFVRCHQYRH